MNYIGIDNGVTGTIGIAGDDIEPQFIETPTFKGLSYTKKVKNISRIDLASFRGILERAPKPCIILLERPMVNPGRFEATISAVRALEAMLIVIEDMGIGYRYIDSKEWQKKILPEGLKGSKVLKKASGEIGTRLFPQFSKEIKHHGDADGLLIAEWARRNKV